MDYEEKRFKYPLWGTLLTAGPPSICFLLGVVTLLIWMGAVFGLLPESWWGDRAIGDYFGLLFGGLIPLFIGAVMLSLYTEIIVMEDGMKVRVFVFKWVFVPWEDVLSFTLSPLVPDSNLGQFIQVKRLTVFHRLASLSYLTGSTPIIIVNKHMQGYNELLEAVEKHMSRGRETHKVSE